MYCFVHQNNTLLNLLSERKLDFNMNINIKLIKVATLLCFSAVFLCSCSVKQNEILAFKQFSEGTFMFVGTVDFNQNKYNVQANHYGTHNSCIKFLSPENVNGLEQTILSDKAKSTFLGVEFERPLDLAPETTFIYAFNRFMNEIYTAGQTEDLNGFVLSEKESGEQEFTNDQNNSVVFMGDVPKTLSFSNGSITVEITKFEYVE